MSSSFSKASAFTDSNAPAMGWNGWNHFRCSEELNETTFLQMTDKIVSSGLKDAGYEYVNLDDCWQISRSKEGVLQVDEDRFPHGIKFLADYVHSKGLKFGIYTSAGRITCEGRPGSLGFEKQDMQLFESWEVDYVKIDWCGTDYLDPLTQYLQWKVLFSQSSRPMKFSIAIGPAEKNMPWIWGAEIADSWRVARDIADDWDDMLRVHNQHLKLVEYSKPGHWNDADMLQVGNGNMSQVQNETHFKLWAFMNSPLILGNDIRVLDPKLLATVTNRSLISLNQDLSYSKPKVLDLNDNIEVLAKAKRNGSTALLLLNKTLTTQKITVNAEKIGLLGITNVSNLTSFTPINLFSSIVEWVPPQSASIVKVYGIPKSFPFISQDKITSLPIVHTGFLSDQNWFKEENGVGPVLRDSVIGTTGEPQGTPITIFPDKNYNKGLGVHAYSRMYFFLNNNCQNLSVIAGLPSYLPIGTTVGFSIQLDGETVFLKTLSGRNPAESIQLDLKGKNFLSLEVFPPDEDTVDFEHAVWAMPYVTCSTD